MRAGALLKLRRAGFTDSQVEALAGYIDAEVASRVARLKLRAEFAGLRADFQAFERRMTIKLGAVGIAAVAITGALAKLL